MSLANVDCACWIVLLAIPLVCIVVAVGSGGGWDDERRAINSLFRQRTALTDDELHMLMAHIGLRREEFVETARELESILGDKVGLLRPDDNIAVLYAGLDLYDVFVRLSTNGQLKVGWEKQAGPTLADLFAFDKWDRSRSR